MEDANYKELKDDVLRLEKKVSEHDGRLAAIESKQDTLHQEVKDGFSSLGTRLNDLYEERKEWSKWLRENIPVAAKWFAKWGLILTFLAVGVNNVYTIIKAWRGM